jgi:tetratricopeptide (TPR) repeat protein
VIRFIWKLGGTLTAAAFFVCSACASDYPFEGLTDPGSQLETLCERSHDNPTPELLTTAGWLLHVYRNDHEQARQFFEKALDAQPRNAWARYGLSVINEMEGRFDDVLSDSLVLCEDAPSHPVALLALLNIRGLFGQIPDFNRRVESVLEAVLHDGRSDSVEFDEICREILCAICRVRGDAEGLKLLVQEGHYVTEWQVVGPFGEYPNLSFLSLWPPQTDRALKSRYKSDGKVVRRRSYSADEGPFRPLWAKRGVYYAETFLRCAASQEAVFRISSPFPLELFLNNHCVYVKDSIRSHEPLVEYVQIRLLPGDNRLLMKCLMGGWGFSTNAFYKSLRLRCLSPRGSLAPTIQVFRYPYGSLAMSVIASGRRSPRVQQVEHSPYQPAPLDYFSQLRETNPRDPLAPGICGILKSVQGDSQDAKRLLLDAMKGAPSYAYFDYILGTVLNSDLSLPVQVRRSEAKIRFHSALENAKSFPLALYELALLDEQEEKELEAIEKLHECVARSSGFFSFHERLYSLYQKKEWRPEQKRQLEEMLSLGVESCEPYHIAEDFYRSTNQHEKLARAVEALQRTHVHAEYLARHLSECGQDSAAIPEYLKLKADQPKKQAIRKSLIELYERSGRWVDAEKELKDTLKRFPRNLLFLKMLADLESYRGRTWSERQTWKRILRLNPVDDDVRRGMRAVGWDDPLDDYDIPSLPYVSDLDIRKKYAGVSSAMIIDQTVEEIHSNGSSRQRTHQLILLNDRKAIDRWGELDVPQQELLELRTIKQDGTIVEPESPEEGKTSFSMPGLQEGDFIEYKYVTTSSVPAGSPRRYLGAQFFFQSVEIPMELSQYIVIVPQDMKLQHEEVNHPPALSVMRKNGNKVYKWEARDVPAVPREPLAASETEFLPFVRVGMNCDGGAEILRYQDYNVTKVKITDEIRETTTRVLADCSGDIESRARAIYSFVGKEVRGGGGIAFLIKSASETLADRNGDRLALAKAMLDAAGIQSQMLVAQRRLAHRSKVFPDSFGSGLLAIVDNDGRRVRYLDFGSRYLPYGYVSAAFQGGIAVPMQDFASADFGLSQHGRDLSREQVTIPTFPTDDNGERRTLDASVSEDGSIEGTQVHSYTGDRAASLRTSFLGAEEYQVREFVERTANMSVRAATLTHYDVSNLSDPEKPLSLEYRFRAPNFGRIIGKEMLLEQVLPRLQLAGHFATLETRKTPLEIDSDINNRFIGMLKLPPGVEVASIPSSLSLETEFGRYHLNFAKTDSGVRAEFDLHLKAQRISPEDYPEFTDFCRAIDEAERGEIKLRFES